MIARLVTKDDKLEILDWLNGHRFEVVELPRIGFRCGSAACFVVQGECGMAFLEYLVKKPGVTDNGDEIRLSYMACLTWAQKNGYTQIFALTKSKAVANYAYSAGFKKQPHTLLKKEFT